MSSFEFRQQEMDYLEQKMKKVIREAYDIGYSDGRDDQTTIFIKNLADKVGDVKFKEDTNND